MATRPPWVCPKCGSTEVFTDDSDDAGDDAAESTAPPAPPAIDYGPALDVTAECGRLAAAAKFLKGLLRVTTFPGKVKPGAADFTIEAAADDHVTMRLHGHEFQARAMIPAEVRSRGVAALHYDRLDRFAQMPHGADPTAIVKTAGGALRLVNGSTVTLAMANPTERVPAYAGWESHWVARIGGAGLAALASAAGFAADADSRYGMTRVMIEQSAAGEKLFGAGKLVAIATDGRRAHFVAIEAGIHRYKTDTAPATMLPAVLCQKLASLWRKSGDVALDVGTVDGGTTAAALVDNASQQQVIRTDADAPTFPPAWDVVPAVADSDCLVVADKAELVSAMEAAAAAIGPDSKGVKMAVVRDGVQWSATDGEGGAATGRFPAAVTNGGMKIGFHPEFLLQAVRAMPGEKISIRLTAPNRPARIQCERGTALHVLMPVNLQ